MNNKNKWRHLREQGQELTTRELSLVGLEKTVALKKAIKTHHDNLAQIIHKSRLWIKPSIVL